MRSFMIQGNQGFQKDVTSFTSDCLDCNAQLVGGGQYMRTKEEAPIRGWRLSTSGKFI